MFQLSMDISIQKGELPMKLSLSLPAVFKTLAFVTWCSIVAPVTFAQNNAALDKKIQAIVERPEFRHSRFGMEVYSLDTHRIIYALNAQQLFVPGSTTKLLSEGTAIKLLGPDFRFKTRVYRTGPIDAKGTLKGDLVQVARRRPRSLGSIAAGWHARVRGRRPQLRTGSWRQGRARQSIGCDR